MGHKDAHGGPIPHGPAADPIHEPESHGTASPGENAEGNCETLWVDLGGEG